MWERDVAAAANSSRSDTYVLINNLIFRLVRKSIRLKFVTWCLVRKNVLDIKGSKSSSYTGYATSDQCISFCMINVKFSSGIPHHLVDIISDNNPIKRYRCA